MGFLKRLFGGSSPSEDKPDPLRSPQYSEEGFFEGKHHSQYQDEIQSLRDDKDWKAAEELLWKLVPVVERESRDTRAGVDPWVYNELARIYRRRRDLEGERDILQRHSDHQIAGGYRSILVMELMERLDRVKEKIAD